MAVALVRCSDKVHGATPTGGSRDYLTEIILSLRLPLSGVHSLQTKQAKTQKKGAVGHIKGNK